MELKQFKIAVLPLRDKLLSYARKLTDDHSDAEDAVQEVMLKLWNLRPKLDEYHSIEALAMTMTHHTCMDILRGKHPDNLSLDSVQAASPVATPERLLEEKDEFSLMRHQYTSTSATDHPPDERCRRVRNRRNRRDNRMQLRSHPQQFIQGTEKSKRHLPANHTTKKKEKRSMNIEELLNKYFEGETTCEEERELRRFFTRGIVPEHLQMYRPMFAFLNEENRQSKTAVPEVPKTSVPLRRRLLYIFSGMAAGILLILGIAGLNRHFNTSTANYVIIDGKCYTDAKLVREQAMIAFRDVSISEEEVFATLFSE